MTMKSCADLLAAIFPLALLVYLMTKRKPMPSYQALPLTALLLYLVRLIYFGAEPTLVNATVVSGLLTALTPVLIVWGAVFLFKTLEHSGEMDVIRRWLNGISRNRVAQLMIIGWAFSFFIEGASGFGTPAALAAPILVGLGFPPLRVAMLCLVMNSVPVSFGAVGTPTWFGFGDLGLGTEGLLAVGFKTAVIHSVAALVIPPLALLFVVSKDDLRANIGFVYLSIASCVLPYLMLAGFDYEFPSILGGGVGLLLSSFFAYRGVGLAAANDKKPEQQVSRAKLARALFPLWGTALVLLLTRISQLGIKGLLNAAEPSASFSLGGLGNISISPFLVVRISDIFGTDVAWVHKFLYVPSIIPFFLVSAIAFAVFRLKLPVIKKIWGESAERMRKPFLALLGALVFVKLLTSGGDQSCTLIISRAFTSATGSSWPLFASYLGALGSFFSGSNTVSNLTFGGIQEGIALSLELDRHRILALQSAGGAMGNMICIHNIVAVCSILGIVGQEGEILKKTVIPLLIYGAIAAAVGLVL